MVEATDRRERTRTAPTVPATLISRYEPLSYSLPIIDIEVYRAGQADVAG
jgi:hypothetical protein